MRNSVSDVTDAEILDETREAMTQAAFDAADEANAAQAWIPRRWIVPMKS